MKKTLLYIGFCIGSCALTYAQCSADSTKDLRLKEVVVNGKTGLDSIGESKPLSSLDEHLQKLSKVTMIKRGGYAWEPAVNNMATERISVTIDGMKIFCACTDKMDPVTSYVEILNLNNIHVGSGLAGNLHGTNSIGGGLDLKLQKAGFHSRKLSLTLNSAYETNGNYRVLGTGLTYSSPSFYMNSGAFYRKSNDYRAGNDERVDFSQFEKLNLFTNAGYKLSNHRALEGTIIYDVASNVGYPALTMDVKSAKGLITSLSYRQDSVSRVFSDWETKLYYNNIAHIMDDTKRPDVVMHMDMPGKSRTCGYYSTLNGKIGRHAFVVSQDTYYNQSLAEMTMYPKDVADKQMFMYTWPDVRTLNSGISFEDKYVLDLRNVLRVTSKLSFQRDGVESNSGYNTLQMYYPGMTHFQNRFLWNVNGKYTHYFKDVQLKAGAGYGTRAPSPTEAYGFYLFNSFDNYDYIGNPQLKNESSAEGNLCLALTKPRYSISLEGSYFYFSNYIIGKPDKSLSPMTLGASGVKVYGNLPHAKLFNVNLDTKVLFLRYFHWVNRAAFSLGEDNKQNALPLIAPFTYSSSVEYLRKKVFGAIEWQGAIKQYKYSPEYGEDETPAYSILNVSAGYDISFKHTVVNIKTGVENIFDRRYSTYADWNNIPRKGRNVFLSLTIHVL
ncbi:MAG: TonB-dependent receptor [Bacteroidota bacterium]|nr:TonB-dependent receptor [Bacteroidota bacterium]